MIEVIPFKGLLYNLDIIGSLDEVTAPSYDVLSADQQEVLYQKNPHNVVRLILGKESEKDSETDNRYTRSVKAFEDWINEGILKRDDEPGFIYTAKNMSLKEKIFAASDFLRLSKQKTLVKVIFAPMNSLLLRQKPTAPNLSTLAMLISSPSSVYIPTQKVISIFFFRRV